MSEFIYQPGMAHVKPEYIEESFKNKNQKYEVPETNEISETNENQENHESKEPAAKKPKVRGMNKNRNPSHLPKDRIDPNVKKICPYIKSSNECPYGEKCNYEHNIDVALTTKTTNLPGECYNFKTKGFCSMGFMCLFSESHISEKGENMRDEATVASYIPVYNVLSVDIKDLLRKKKYNFGKTYANLDSMKISYQKDKFSLSIEGDYTEKRAKRTVDFTDKLYLAPLTTVGNLPFRRICKELGADITCSEMAMTSKLLQGVQSEWALLKRHPTEDVFGVQLCGAHPDSVTKATQLVGETCRVDFVDLNCGCPIDLVCHKGEGCGLLRGGGSRKLENIVAGMASVIDCPITVKCRMGYSARDRTTHTLVSRLREAGASMVAVHGRTREQRYNNAADWDYIGQCATAASPMPVYGNGDVMSYEDYETHRHNTGVAGVMVARGALIKPWLFTEIKERRTIDMSSGQRLELLRKFTNYGLEYWGSDLRGVENTRRFMLEWLSFLHRYIPAGLLEHLPQQVNLRPPPYFGRDDLETLMASSNCADWVKISEMLLGPVPDRFNFVPKHRANSFV